MRRTSNLEPVIEATAPESGIVAVAEGMAIHKDKSENTQSPKATPKGAEEVGDDDAGHTGIAEAPSAGPDQETKTDASVSSSIATATATAH